MTVCKFWQQGECRYDDDYCWYDHYEEGEESESDSESLGHKTCKSIPSTSATVAGSTSEPQISASITSTHSAPVPQPTFARPSSQQPKCPQPTAGIPSNPVGVITPVHLRAEPQSSGETTKANRIEVKHQSQVDTPEGTTRRMEASASLDRQRIEIELLRDELIGSQNKNRSLQVELKTLETKLRTEISALEHQLEASQKADKAFETRYIRECESSKGYKKILEDVQQVATKGLESMNERQPENQSESSTMPGPGVNISTAFSKPASTPIGGNSGSSTTPGSYPSWFWNSGKPKSSINGGSGEPSTKPASGFNPFNLYEQVSTPNNPPPQYINANAMPSTIPSAPHFGFSRELAQPTLPDPNASIPFHMSNFAPPLFGTSAGSSIDPIGRYGGIFDSLQSSEEAKPGHHHGAHAGLTPKAPLFSPLPNYSNNFSVPNLFQSQQSSKRKREDTQEGTKIPAPYALNSSSLSIDQKYHVQEYGEGIGEREGHMPRSTGAASGHGGLQSATASATRGTKAGEAKGKNGATFKKATIEDAEEESSQSKKAKNSQSW